MPATPLTPFAAQRWREFIGEAQANRLRVTALAVFYVVHLWAYLSSIGKLPALSFLQLADAGAISPRYHTAITCLALVWVLVALGVQFCLRSGVFPRWFGYATISADVLLATALLCLGAGPRSALVTLYFLLLIAAAMRSSWRLVIFTTAACVVSYLAVLGDAKFALTTLEETDVIIPRYQQAQFLGSLLLAGWGLAWLTREGDAPRSPF